MADVYLLDDNTRGRSRAQELCDACAEVGLQAEYFSAFSKLKEAYNAGNIDPNALFVLDNIIVEPGRRVVDFNTTVPELLRWGVSPDHMLPASSALTGSEANTELFPLLLRRGILRDGQYALAYGGFENMDPKMAATKLKSYHDELRMSGGEGSGFLQ